MRDINMLHPELIEILNAFVAECRRQGLEVGVADTFRTKFEQDALYAQGRTEPGSIVTKCKYPYSPHNWGLAFDIYRNDGKGAYNDSDGWFAKCGAVGKKMGLAWGGDFKKFVDKPHFELAKYLPYNSCVQLKSRYKTPEKFKVTWEEYMKEFTQTDFDAMMENWLDRQAAKAPTPKWGCEAVQLGKQLGISDGTRPGSFATREEVLTMVLRGMKCLQDMK